MKTKVIDWFLKNETDLALNMQETFHGYLGIEDNPYHLEGSVWEHTTMVLDKVEELFPEDEDLFWIALLHDIGKTKTFQDNHKSKRRNFNNHENVSVLMAKAILDKTDLEKDRKIRILNIIGLHGRLYNYIRENKIAPVIDMFQYHSNLFSDLQKFYICDHKGRKTSKEIEISSLHSVMEWFNNIKESLELVERLEKDSEKTRFLTMLIGLPRAGKSTWRSTRTYTPEFAPIVISRDDILMEYSNGKSYSETWKSLTESEQKEIDIKIKNKFRDAVSNGKNILIDMTNLSKKSRKKWLKSYNLDKYLKKAVIFPEDAVTCNNRNSDEKHIPIQVLENMEKSFVVPLYDEFDEIEWVL